MKKEFYQIGNCIYFLTEDEVALVNNLYDNNLLRFPPRKIDLKEVYGYHENESE